MKAFLILIAVLGVGLGAGAGSALWLSGQLPDQTYNMSKVSVGGWQSDWATASKRAGPYLRAHTARHNPLALPSTEAVYFIKAVDDFGDPLTETCTYRVSGRSLPADWWSITLYTPGNTLLHTETVTAQPSFVKPPETSDTDVEDWSFLVSATPPEDEDMIWISSQSAPAFDLMLRLYRPKEDVINHPKRTLRTPTIERLTCMMDKAS